jgi:aspartate aminotransferase-like enzyme
MSTYEPSLFIPGPTDVFPEVREQLLRPVISHRGAEVSVMTLEIFDDIRRVMKTKNLTFVATSSSTGVMEGAIRNTVKKRVLNTVCGAFSELMWKVATKNGKTSDAYTVPPGHEIDPDEVRRRLKTGGYDAVCLTHSETATGVLNDIATLAEVVREFDDVILIVDVVSSLAGAPVDVDAWGADIVFAGVQKCLALPPGLCVFSMSERAFKRAESIDDRGHYFDFLNYRKMGEKGQIPATTAVSLLFALHFQLKRILAEGLENRWARHAAMAKYVRDRVLAQYPNFPLFPQSKAMTPAESVFANPTGFPIGKLVDAMKKRGKTFGNGYGDLKEKTFRIGHMGDIQPAHMVRFMDLFSEAMDEVKKAL